MTPERPYRARVTAGETIFWCACGRSKNQPYCDGSHKGTAHRPLRYEVSADLTVALCGCKATRQPPFCDGSHAKKGFQDTGVLGVNVVKTVEADSQDRVLRISSSTDGPFALKGEAEIVSADGQTCYSGNRMYLCRCGASSNKPFCDGTHAKIGFTSGE